MGTQRQREPSLCGNPISFPNRSLPTKIPKPQNPTPPRQVVLEYTGEAKGGVLNPYIHFGQPSVWPRGFPLQRVPDHKPKPRYAEGFSGAALLRQGLIDGEGDLDEIFRTTRRSR